VSGPPTALHPCTTPAAAIICDRKLRFNSLPIIEALFTSTYAFSEFKELAGKRHVDKHTDRAIKLNDWDEAKAAAKKDLKKANAILLNQEKQRSRMYCGPVLRHPAGPIQAANFRLAITF
jgi:hypothetical protein